MRIYLDHEMRSDDLWFAKIEELLRQTRCVVCLLAQDSVARQLYDDPMWRLIQQERRHREKHEPHRGMEIMPVLMDNFPILDPLLKRMCYVSPYERPSERRPKHLSLSDDYAGDRHALITEVVGRAYESLSEGHKTIEIADSQHEQKTRIHEEWVDTESLLLGRSKEGRLAVGSGNHGGRGLGRSVDHLSHADRPR